MANGPPAPKISATRANDLLHHSHQRFLLKRYLSAPRARYKAREPAAERQKCTSPMSTDEKQDKYCIITPLFGSLKLL